MYENKDVFVLVFLVSNRSTYTNITALWLPELQNNTPNAARLLVGINPETRDEDSTSLKTTVTYVSCSSSSSSFSF